jgi:hypothetical protein
MRLTPIPRYVLSYSCILYKRNGVDEYGQPSYDSGVTIKYIHIEPMTVSKLKSLGEFKDDKVTLFYDYSNSLPNNLTFSPLDKIEFDNEEYIVRDSMKYLDHHEEVFLK